MSSSLYLLFFLLPVILSIAIVLFIINKKNSHTELYSEGVRNENEGRYSQALHNYEGALVEIRKLRMNRRFGKKIAERIKILQTTINYEKNFQDGIRS